MFLSIWANSSVFLYSFSVCSGFTWKKLLGEIENITPHNVSEIVSFPQRVMFLFPSGILPVFIFKTILTILSDMLCRRWIRFSYLGRVLTVAEITTINSLAENDLRVNMRRIVPLCVCSLYGAILLSFI